MGPIYILEDGDDRFDRAKGTGCPTQGCPDETLVLSYVGSAMDIYISMLMQECTCMCAPVVHLLSSGPLFNLIRPCFLSLFVSAGISRYLEVRLIAFAVSFLCQIHIHLHINAHNNEIHSISTDKIPFEQEDYPFERNTFPQSCFSWR